MRTLGWVAAAAIVLTAAGCKKDPSLVGSWQGELQGQQATFNFKEDNTMEVKANVASYEATVTGTYKVDGKNLSMTASKVDIKGFPPQIKKQVDEAASKQMGKEQTATVAWKGDDEFELTPATAGKDGKPEANKEKPVTFKRQKEAK